MTKQAKQELTEWFPPCWRPAYEGWYESYAFDPAGANMYWWDGKRWAYRVGGMPCEAQARYWRGLKIEQPIFSDIEVDEVIKKTEEEVGMSSSAWDCISPREIVRAVINNAKDLTRSEAFAKPFQKP